MTIDLRYTFSMRLAVSFACCLLLLGLIEATVRATDKQASAYCHYIAGEEGALQVNFNVRLNTDPVGRMIALSNTAYNQNPKVYSSVTPCVISYDTTNKVYSVTSKKDRLTTDTIDRDSNLCGMTEKTENGVKVYEQLFLHQIMTNNFAMIDDKDRVYIVRCTESNTASNMVTTSITVQAPNLPVTATISSLPITLSLWLKNTAANTYSMVSATQAVPVGSTVRLQLELDRGANYVANLNMYGIYTFLTEAGASSSFNQMDYLVDSNGCKYGGSSNAAPYLPTQGFKGTVQTVTGGSRYTLTSGDFTLWKYDTSDRIYFRTYYGICFADNAAPCTNLCKARTGNEARRKRQTEEEELGIAVTSVRLITVAVEDSQQSEAKSSTADAANSTTVLIVLGSILGALVLMLLAVTACTVAVIRRRQEQTKRHNRFENMSVASTTVTSVSKN